MKKNIAIVVFCFVLTTFSSANAKDFLIKTKSPYTVKETIDRFEKNVKSKGMTIFARVDHSNGAAKVGKKLLPTELLIFGNPKIGTSFMLSEIESAIDLPMKILAWEGDQGEVWIGYSDPEILTNRHEIKGLDGLVKKIRGNLSNFVKAAVSNK